MKADSSTPSELSYLLLLRPPVVVLGFFGCVGALAGLGLGKANVVDQLVLTDWTNGSFGAFAGDFLLNVSFGWVPTLSVAVLYVMAMEIGPSGRQKVASADRAFLQTLKKKTSPAGSMNALLDAVDIVPSATLTAGMVKWPMPVVSLKRSSRKPPSWTEVRCISRKRCMWIVVSPHRQRKSPGIRQKSAQSCPSSRHMNSSHYLRYCCQS